MSKLRALRLEGTETAENLAKAFVGESQARNRYTFYAELAAEAGYPTLEGVFLATAHDERGHAEKFFEYLAEGLGKTQLTPEALVPVALGATAENLQAAYEGEHFEWTELYPAFAKAAHQEGFLEIATSFESIASVEKRHDLRFRDLLTRLETGSLFQACRPVTWHCLNCGFRHASCTAPDSCPACHHAQTFFTIVDPCIL